MQEDHPRGCGEHIQAMRETVSREGSSPRMRGAPAPCRPSCEDSGIIPADAGSTRLPLMDICPDRDHPRGCGEHFVSSSIRQGHLGSSPRMRGARLSTVSPGARARIIPADAGSTSPLWLESPGNQDHPRGCGEHCACGLPCLSWSGSSPRMRGAPSAGPRVARSERIIPADAGSTQEYVGGLPERTDHPRGCGEHPFR